MAVACYEPPRFRPLSRSAPIGFQRRREPAPLMFSSNNKLRLRDQFKSATSNLPMKTYKVQLPRGSSTRIMPMFSALTGGSRLQPLTTVSPSSPTIIVKPVLSTKPGAVLNPLPLTANPATYIKLSSRPKEQLNSNSNKNSQYTYEKPGASSGKYPQKFKIRLPVEADSGVGAIHTIPAPNLSVKDNKIQFFSSAKPEKIQSPFKRPVNNQNVIPQYEVQEFNNDIELNNPYTGKKGLYAPDPDPLFPNPRLQPNIDPFSTPSNFRPLPYDISAQVVQPSYVASPSQYMPQTAPAAQYVQAPMYPYYQPQGSAPAYAYVQSPMLAQASYQQPQAAMLQGMAPYNPSFVISQSNNLFNQHQNQLMNYNKVVPQINDNALNYAPYPDNANGQYYEATDEQLRQIQNLHAAATQLQYSSTNSLDNYEDSGSFQGYNSISESPSLQNGNQNNAQYVQDQAQYSPSYSTTSHQQSSNVQPAVYSYDQTYPQQDQNYPHQDQNYPQQDQNYPSNPQIDQTYVTNAQQQQQPQPSQEQDYAQSYFQYAQGQALGQQSQGQLQQQPQQSAHQYQQPQQSNQEILENEASLTPQSAYEQHQLALQSQLSKSTETGAASQQLRIYVPDDSSYSGNAGNSQQQHYAQSKSDESEEEDYLVTESPEDEAQERMDFLLDSNGNDEYQYVDDYGQEADHSNSGASSTAKSFEDDSNTHK